MKVSIVNQALDEDRILPRLSRYLNDYLGWPIHRSAKPGYDLTYLSSYLEKPGRSSGKVAAYFTHLETNEKAKAAIFWERARTADLRIVTAPQYFDLISIFGPTVLIPLPVDPQFQIGPNLDPGQKPILGFSGFTYASGRKGEALADQVVKAFEGQYEFRATGRGWPCPTKKLKFSLLPRFYNSLSALVCTSTVEGGPMPPLEALACGVPVIIPRGVGLLDTLGEADGIIRYEAGDAESLKDVISRLECLKINRDALRATVAPFTVGAWVQGHIDAFGGILEEKLDTTPIRYEAQSERGIFTVAFGEPSREAASKLFLSAKRVIPEVPITLVSDRPLGLEDNLIVLPDSDIGGRRAKLQAYDLSPYETTLYLDADTEIISRDVLLFFSLIESGWEFVICKDAHNRDLIANYKRPDNLDELKETEEVAGSSRLLQYNGGVWAFKRSPRLKAFFDTWRLEWEKYGKRDQGALIRALHLNPLRFFVLGNEFNHMGKYSPNTRAAAILHTPGTARRWDGAVNSRLDDPEAWRQVETFNKKRDSRGNGRSSFTGAFRDRRLPMRPRDKYKPV